MMFHQLITILVLTAPVTLQSGDLKLELARPGTYYQGTRFDWAGVFRSIEYQGTSFCDEWFDENDPLRHDNVCGPSEEFYGAYGYDEASPGETFLKVGVGLLEKESYEPYDWARTYRIADKGRRKLSVSRSKAVFSHEVKGWYKYRKTVKINDSRSFSLVHRLKNVGKDTLNLRQYCHNLFTFGKDTVGSERSVEFDFPICGDWREDNIHGRKEGRRIWMDGTIEKGRKSFIGNLKATGPQDGGYGLVLKSGDMSIRIVSDRPMGESVFWSNHRVFCPEPYIDLTVAPGEEVEWVVSFTFSL